MEALEEERSILSGLGGTKWHDPWCEPGIAAGDALYHDCSVLPPGSSAPELVRWCRIGDGKEILGCCVPKLFPEVNSSWAPVQQGSLANAWWLNAVALLTSSESGRLALRNLVVSHANARDGGIYTVRFWKQGGWTYVHVDDRIPCDVAGRPLYSRSRDPNETWLLIIEKAYAKIHGSYLNLENGRTIEALRDLTGGAASWMPLDDWYTFSAMVPKLPQLNKDTASVNDTASTCAIIVGMRVKPSTRDLQRRSDGLLSGWMYGVRGGFQDAHGKSLLVRFHDPWQLSQWRGPWSNTDHNSWQMQSDVKEKLNPDDEWPEDEFHMSWDTACSQFGSALVCQFPRDPDRDDSSTRLRFSGVFEKGNLVSGAGGSPIDEVSWLTNPMVAFSIHEPTYVAALLGQDDDPRVRDFFCAKKNRGFITKATTSHNTDEDIDEDGDSDKESTGGPGSKLDSPMRDSQGIGIAMLKIGDVSSKHHRAQSFHTSKVVTHSGEDYRTDREVACIANLGPGKYVIVPSTFAAHITGNFILEVLLDKPARATFVQTVSKPLLDQLNEEDNADKSGLDEDEEEDGMRGRGGTKINFHADLQPFKNEDLADRQDLELHALQTRLQLQMS